MYCLWLKHGTSTTFGTHLQLEIEQSAFTLLKSYRITPTKTKNRKFCNNKMLSSDAKHLCYRVLTLQCTTMFLFIECKLLKTVWKWQKQNCRQIQTRSITFLLKDISLQLLGRFKKYHSLKEIIAKHYSNYSKKWKLIYSNDCKSLTQIVTW